MPPRIYPFFLHSRLFICGMKEESSTQDVCNVGLLKFGLVGLSGKEPSRLFEKTPDVAFDGVLQWFNKVCCVKGH